MNVYNPKLPKFCGYPLSKNCPYAHPRTEPYTTAQI
jgi:hypothetical protein